MMKSLSINCSLVVTLLLGCTVSAWSKDKARSEGPYPMTVQSWTEQDIAKQYETARSLGNALQSAIKNGDKTIPIAPGDYRFGREGLVNLGIASIVREKNTITDAAVCGIFVSSAERVRITDNTINGALIREPENLGLRMKLRDPRYGIFVTRSEGVEMADNAVSNLGAYAIGAIGSDDGSLTKPTRADVVVPAATGAPLSPATFGMLKNLPVYMQEWHVWWGYPYPDTSKPLEHLASSFTSFREPWRLQWNRNGYPLVGLYDSSNQDIIRWQIRCMKAAGLTSVAAMLHPDNQDGVNFIQEEFGLIDTILRIAAEERFPVFFMDVVAFRRVPKPRDPGVMAERVVRFLKRYGSNPGFYKIDGKPVYYYQTFGYDVSAETTDAMMAAVEKQVGPVHWMVFGPVAQMSKVEHVRTIVSGASIHRTNRTTREPLWDRQNPRTIIPAIQAAGKLAGGMHYPKFDETGLTNRPSSYHGIALYGAEGDTLQSVLADSLQAKPDLVMLSSWNDYEEGAYMEPSWDFDGFNGDPYAYCRLLAHLRGITFVAPPLPPKEAVHPSIWEKLGYGDGAGPIIDAIHRSHVRGGSLEVVARDTMNAVTDLEIVWDGEVWWRAPQGTGGLTNEGLVLKQGDISEPKSVT